MCRLICAFVVCIWHKQVFSWRGSSLFSCRFWMRQRTVPFPWIRDLRTLRRRKRIFPTVNSCTDTQRYGYILNQRRPLWPNSWRRWLLGLSLQYACRFKSCLDYILEDQLLADGQVVSTFASPTSLAWLKMIEIILTGCKDKKVRMTSEKKNSVE